MFACVCDTLVLLPEVSTAKVASKNVIKTGTMIQNAKCEKLQEEEEEEEEINTVFM